MKRIIALAIFAAAHSASAQSNDGQSATPQTQAAPSDAVQLNDAQPNIVRQDSSVSVAFPTPPPEISGPANDYRSCLGSSIMGKPLTPTIEAAFEEGIRSCAELRAQNEEIARKTDVAGWPAPGTPERAIEVTKLFDAIDDAHRSAAKAMEAQIAQAFPSFPQTEKPDAPNH